MRIIVTGQAGTAKKTFAERIVKHVLEQRRIPKTSSQYNKNREIKWYEVESKDWLKVDFRTFLTDYNESKQQDKWAESITAINKDIANKNPKDCLLLLHATWYRNNRFFSPLSWDKLISFKPDCVINLIDDLYDTWQRVEEGPHDTHLSLHEILSWRSVESTLSKTIALQLRIDPEGLDVKQIPSQLQSCFGSPLPHFIMAVKHPPETFYRLMFEKNERPVVYASFPITRTRGKSQRALEIESFLQKLHEAGVIVINPLTIDEMRMKRNNPHWLELNNENSFNEYQGTRWQVADPTVPPPCHYKNPFRDSSDAQIKDTVGRIEQHVVARDFDLIAQCQMLIAYRPFYPESGDQTSGPPTSTPTGGVSREISHALELGKTVWVVDPPSDCTTEREEDFFSQYAQWGRARTFSSLDELLKEISMRVKASAN